MAYISDYLVRERITSPKKKEDFTDEQNEKYNYVKDYLAPSIKNAKCGWDDCVYIVTEDNYEYIRLYATNGSERLINVTCRSLGAIAKTTWAYAYN